LKLLLIDNEDSFVHILADYFRQTGAEVTTYRHGLDLRRIEAMAPDLVVHSPGPGRPEEFGVPRLVRALADAGIAQFGVCLGLQGMVEAFGGRLSLLDQPRQGKPWTITHDGVGLFAGLPSPCHVGAYHALYADESALPGCLEVLARNELGIVMAIRHRQLPISAVQFHPESILSLTHAVGHRLVANVMRELRAARR
jgi:anthranilate synthase